MMITQKKIKTMLTFATVAMAIFVVTAHQVSAVELTHVETVEVSSDHSVFEVSVFPGKAGYDDGVDSGVFGDGTVADYRFFNSSGTTFNGAGYVNGGAGLVSQATATNSNNTNGGALDWADVWTTSDPDAEAANFTSDTVARSQGVSGTIDISGIAAGTLYFIYGSFEDLNTIALTMSGASQPDVLADHTEDPPGTNKCWISSFDFSNAAAYDTISYSYTNNDTDASRARFMGVIVTNADPMNPSPYNGETVPPANPLTLSWTNLDPNTVPRPPVFVDVWFGTDPEALAQVPGVSGVADANSVAVDASAVGVYYWRVDSYLGGSPTGDPNVGTLWTFSTDFPPSSVEILTPDMITWSGRGVDLDGTFVDDSDPLDWTIAWSADPDAGVVFLPNANDLTPTVEITAPPHRVVREIQVEGDDTEEHVNIQAISGSSYAQGGIDLASSDLEVGAEGDGGLDWQVCAVQYDQLGIPQGATITGAKITFTVDNSGAAGTSNDFTIYAEAADDASVFSTDPFDVTDRALSTASVPWAPAASPAVGTKIDTPDITGLIQEVVDRAGWSDNNRLTLMIYPDVYLASPTGGSTTVQEIEFEAGPGSDSATLTVGYESTDSFDPVTVTLTLGVNDVINPEAVTDTMTIDVYDTRCRAANGAGQLDPADFDENCIVNLADLVIFLDEFLTCTTPNVPGCVETYRP